MDAIVKVKQDNILPLNCVKFVWCLPQERVETLLTLNEAADELLADILVDWLFAKKG